MTNTSKTPVFTQAERVALIRRCVADIPNVEVEQVGGLLADYVRERIWATNQQIEDCEDGGLILTLTTRSEPELRAWVRSFGDAAVLLEDDTPREQD